MSRFVHDTEVDRLRTLRRYRILDTPAEDGFDELAFLASRICQTPIAYVSLIDEDRQWFKAKVGISTAETARDGAFCEQAIVRPDEILEVPDAQADSRFATSPLVISEPFARFYAGVPLVAPDGGVLGALCVIDRQPRVLSGDQRTGLRALGRQAVIQLELRRQSRDLMDEVGRRKKVEEDVREQNERLEQSRAETSRLLDLAEESRAALLSVLEDEQHTSRALAHSNRALKMLSRCNEALIWAQDESALLDQICRIAVELGGHLMAWVGYAEDDAEKSIRPIARAGSETGYLDGLALTWSRERPAGRGPAGQCIREARPVVCPDIGDPAAEFHALEEARKRGYRSVICLPIREGGRAFGLLALYGAEAQEIDAGELKSLQDLADDLAFGIGAIRSRVVREEAERALVASLREKEALLKEVHHRVKNNLQVIASLLRMEGRRSVHEAAKSALGQMQGRIYSMALLHETLYRSGNFASVDLKSYLGDLTRQLFRSHALQPGAVQLHLDLASLRVDIDQAIPCGLIVNELASNSLRHGFGNGRTGDLWISLQPSQNGEFVLTVRDNGPGLPEDFEDRRRQSLGLQLVSDLARQLQGRLNVQGPQAQFEVTLTPTRLDPATGTGRIPRPA
ncbi:MAG: GAF domain-containing protein [Vicinamibacteria bacterium]|nr:GAF domain-containing protein [Vicinamibacteria bacterium]